MKRTIGSLTSDDVGKDVRLVEPGARYSGVLASVEHGRGMGIEATTETHVTIGKVGSRSYITRAPSSEIDVNEPALIDAVEKGGE